MFYGREIRYYMKKKPKIAKISYRQLCKRCKGSGFGIYAFGEKIPCKCCHGTGRRF